MMQREKTSTLLRSGVSDGRSSLTGKRNAPLQDAGAGRDGRKGRRRHCGAAASSSRRRRMMAFAWSPLWSLCVLLGFLLPPGDSFEYCEAYKDLDGRWHPQQICSDYCCGTCNNRYCCSYSFQKNYQFLCSYESTFPSFKPEPFKIDPDFEDLYSSDYSGTFIAIGISIFVVFVVGIILCFTCSCCCLYKACRRSPRPVVTTSTTVMQVPYPQQPAVPVAYAGGAYQGYNPLPVQPQPGMPAAPYPTQYPPPYPTQPIRPPPYQETVAVGASAPPAQPPYNPAYMDPPKASY